jgi:hypothetical protein
MHLIEPRRRAYNQPNESGQPPIRKQEPGRRTMKLIPLAIATASLIVVMVMVFTVPAHSTLMAAG